MLDLKERKATGPDDIPAIFIKTFARELASVYSLLFRASLAQGEVPKDWKYANITPIFKKGDTSKPENYRPVSLTSISCKLLEHVIASNMMKHLDQYEILSDVQHGFRRSRSCESQLITTCTDFIDTMNANGQTDAILLDFSKAFDKVHHNCLMTKLEHYGISNGTHSWIKSFLKNRSQRVMVENNLSSSLPVLSGVPQGTVLGPLLFLIYINDMPETVSEGTKIRLFADDSLLYREIKSPKDSAILQEDLNKLQKWEGDSKMQFHPGKCQVIRITKKIKTISHDYTVHNEKLKRTQKAEYLGLTLDEKLSWNSHIDKICGRANSKINFLKRNISNCPKEIKEKCYNVFVRPMLEYCATVWDPHTQQNINKLEQIQKRACRFVNNKYDKEESISNMLRSSNWTSLKERRAKKKAITLFKAQQGITTIPINKLKTNPRKEKSFILPPSRIDGHLNSFFPSAIRMWNSLPKTTRNIDSLDQFKESIDTINVSLSNKYR